MSDKIDREVKNLLHKSLKAYRSGNPSQAWQLAEQAADTAPDQELPWLVLASIASPKESIGYLNKALEINPTSQSARKGMHWAIKRLREESPPAPQPVRFTIPEEITNSSLTRRRPVLPIWLLILLAVFTITILWFRPLSFTPALADQQPGRIARSYAKATLTFTPTSTATPTATPTNTPTSTPTSTPTNTPTATPTATATSTPTNTPTSTPTPEPTKKTQNKPTGNQISLPKGVSGDTRWIDIDLSEQRTYAYVGSQLVNSFIVSTGTWRTPTVTGRYKIYVKYRSADMSGPGYYLADVPFVMYFYKGYGLHGTYWHNNFGTPMSHGCVNLRNEDAKWLFNWASIGTIVNIHP